MRNKDTKQLSIYSGYWPNRLNIQGLVNISNCKKFDSFGKHNETCHDAKIPHQTEHTDQNQFDDFLIKLNHSISTQNWIFFDERNFYDIRTVFGGQKNSQRLEINFWNKTSRNKRTFASQHLNHSPKPHRSCLDWI